MKKNINFNVTVNIIHFHSDLKMSKSQKRTKEAKITTRVNILSVIQAIESIGNIIQLLIALLMSLNIL